MESIRASRELIKEGLLTVETEKLLRDIGKQMWRFIFKGWGDSTVAMHQTFTTPEASDSIPSTTIICQSWAELCSLPHLQQMNLWDKMKDFLLKGNYPPSSLGELPRRPMDVTTPVRHHVARGQGCSVLGHSGHSHRLLPAHYQLSQMRQVGHQWLRQQRCHIWYSFLGKQQQDEMVRGTLSKQGSGSEVEYKTKVLL